MPDTVSDLARRLAENAEAVCRRYLSNGRRQGGYWLAGDVQNTPGRSLYVRLHGPSAGRGAAGKWADAATGEHGDLLDLIAATQHLPRLGDALEEARRFLGLAQAKPEPPAHHSAGSPSALQTAATFDHSVRPTPAGSVEAARRLFAMSTPIAGTLAENYLRTRGIVTSGDATSLRFHPRCFYRTEPGDPDGARNAWPALIAAVTDRDGRITGLQRTYLDPRPDPSGTDKAPVATPRRALGQLLGHAVRFGSVEPASAKAGVMAAGEGIETVLSLRCVLPTMPMVAALSARHLAAFLPPAGLRRLYIVRDNDPAGHWAAEKLAARMQEAGAEALVLAPTGADFNDDLRQLGPGVLASALRVQLVPEDVDRFWRSPECRCQTR